MIFISVASSEQDIAGLLRQSKALTINGPNVVRWAHHLQQVYGRPPPDPATIEAYRNLLPGTAPASLLKTAIFASNKDEASQLARSYMLGNTGRHGYANTPNMPTAEDLATASFDRMDLSPDDPGEIFFLYKNRCCLLFEP